MANPVPRRNMDRSAASCERCKHRKAKCDRQLPSCQRCVQGQAVCEYAGRRKPGFPAGHRLVLEAKIEALEAELRALRGNPEANAPTEATDRAATRPSASSESSLDTVMLSRLTTSATFERTRKIKQRQPPTDLVISLTSLYFRHIHPWFPFLDVQRVFADMGSMDEPSLLYYALFGVTLPYSLDSRLDEVSSDSFWKYSKRSIFVDVLEEPSYSSLEVLTVLVLDLSGMTHGPQVWGPLAVATKLAVQLRNSDGLVFRTATGTQSSESPSQSDRLFRQRLFWAIYSLDCCINITTNHPSTLSDDHIQHFLPAREQVWRDSSPELSEGPLTPSIVFNYQLQLFDLSRRLHKIGIGYATLLGNQEFVASWLDNFHSASAELRTWMQNLPPRLLWHDATIGNAPGAVRPALFMLQSYFHALVIYLHGFVALPAHDALQSEAHSGARQQYLEHCVHSIEVLVKIITKAPDQVLDKLGWPFAWSVWVAGRFLIAQRCATGENGDQTITSMSLFIGFLSRIGRYWQISRTYARLLRQAVSELDTGVTMRQGSVVQLMADLRVPTSHLEDHFRPDPMLRGLVNQDQSASTAENQGYMELEGSDALLPFISEDLYLEMSQQAPDSWFRMPLFASSAYQQFNAAE